MSSRIAARDFAPLTSLDHRSGKALGRVFGSRCRFIRTYGTDLSSWSGMPVSSGARSRAMCRSRNTTGAAGARRCRPSDKGSRRRARTDRAPVTVRGGLDPASAVQRYDVRSAVSPEAWPVRRPHCRPRSTRVPEPSRRARPARRNPASSAPASRAGDYSVHFPLNGLERQIAEPIAVLLGRNNRSEQLGSRIVLPTQQADPGCHDLTHVPESSSCNGIRRKLLQLWRKGYAVHVQIIEQGRACGKVFGRPEGGSARV